MPSALYDSRDGFSNLPILEIFPPRNNGERWERDTGDGRNHVEKPVGMVVNEGVTNAYG